MLKPIEWYRLASTHSWQVFEIGDDFYDNDGVSFDVTKRFPIDASLLAPTLKHVSHSVSEMLDYCLTRWEVGEAEYEVLRNFTYEEVLDGVATLVQREHRPALTLALAVSANVLKQRGSSFVESLYERMCEIDGLSAFAEAAIECLPSERARMLIDLELSRHNGSELDFRKDALYWFKSSETLDWIEVHVPTKNVTESWGRLASVSSWSWNIAEKWLDLGRPLSLVALDALRDTIPWANISYFQKKWKPGLICTVPVVQIEQKLLAYKAKDHVPRVIQRVDYILENLDKIRYRIEE